MFPICSLLCWIKAWKQHINEKIHQEYLWITSQISFGIKTFYIPLHSRIEVFKPLYLKNKCPEFCFYFPILKLWKKLLPHLFFPTDLEFAFMSQLSSVFTGILLSAWFKYRSCSTCVHAYIIPAYIFSTIQLYRICTYSCREQHLNEQFK